MIPLIANIRKAIYCLNKRIDLLDNLIKDMLGLDSSSVLSLINILNDKDASTGILNTLLLKADKSEIPAAQILSDWNLLDDTKLDYIKNKPTTTNGEDGKSAYELYLETLVSLAENVSIIDHTNFNEARHNQLEDYYNNNLSEAAHDGETWPPYGPHWFPWLAINYNFDGKTTIKVYYKGEEKLTWKPSAQVEQTDANAQGTGVFVDRTYGLISLPQDLGLTEFTDSAEGNELLANIADFKVELVKDGLTQEQWLASLKGTNGNNGINGINGKSAYEIYLAQKEANPIYSFTSYNADHTVEYGEGTVQVTKVENGYTFVEVLTNRANDPNAENFVGLTFKVNATELGEDYYQLLTEEGNETGILVAVELVEPLSEAQWLESLKGADGAPGQDGTNGTNGTNGTTPHIDQTTGNWFIGETNTGVKASFSSESAASGGTTLSVVTTGEKYNWNNKANIWRGTQAEYDLISTPDDNTIYIITPDLP